MPEVLARPGLSASSRAKLRSASCGSVAGVAPTARIMPARSAVVSTVTRSPRSTRPRATFSSGPICPMGDSAAIKISAIVCAPFDR